MAQPSTSPLDTLDDVVEAPKTVSGDLFLESCRENLEKHRKESNAAAEVQDLLVIAERLLKSQRLPEANKHAEDALAAAKKSSDSHSEAEALMLQFRIKLAEEEVEAAGKHAEAAVKRFSTLATEKEEMFMSLALADIRVVHGRFKEAERLASNCQKRLKELGDAMWEAAAWEARANACLSAECHDRALHAARMAQELYTQQDDATMQQASMMRMCSRIYSSKGEHVKALAQAQASKKLCEEAMSPPDKKSAATSCDMMANAALIKKDGWKEGVDFAKEAVKLCEEVGDKHGQAAALTTLASAHLAGGSIEEASKAAFEALSLVRSVGDLNAIAEALETLMNVKPEKSKEYAEEELSRARKEGNPKREVAALKRLAGVLFADDQFDDALSKAKEARDVQRKLGDRAGEAITQSVIADYCISQKKHQDALDASRAAQALLKDRKNYIGQAQALQQEFRVHCAMEDVEAARKAAWGQRTIFQEAKYSEQEAATLLEIADFEAHVGGAKEAMKPVELARALYKELEDLDGEADACRAVANIYLAEPDVIAALKAADEALKLSTESNDAKGKASALQTKTSVLVAQEKYEEAAQLAREARNILRDAEHAWTEANAVQMVANVYLAQCQKAAEADKDADASVIKEAQSNAEEAVRLFQNMRDTEGHASALLVASSALYYAQDGERALQHAREALDLYEKFGNNQGMAHAWLAMARGAFLSGTNFDGAVEAAEEARRLAEVLGDGQTESAAAGLVDIITESARKAGG